MKLVWKLIMVALFLGLCNGSFAASKVRTVVIDAGHGGNDSGAVGTFAKEKDINLAIALGLGKMIETHFSDVKVHYTRAKDEFIELWRRPRMANQHKADLFISIHCNSSELRRGQPFPRGFETFVMGLHKSEENLKVAQKENAVIFSEADHADSYDGFNPNSPEAYIIFSLFQNAYLDQSLDFASRLQRHYTSHIPSVDRGVKQAGFLVLHGATMPSVLTEIGFINNPEEEKFMASPEGQEKIITALFNAFREYKNSIDGFNNQSEAVVEKPVNTTAEPVSTVSQNPVPVENTTKNNVPKIVYKVQFASSATDKPLTASEFKNIENPGKYYHQGSYRFTSGEAKSMDEITVTLRKMQSQGYRDAFVVVFKDDERITTAEALKILQEQN
ncbi:MAG: N-acetylmuramoyl-L-alanine amidase [Bacteroidales bacterium]|nr:N-acetylmuramoyl-L-alanine amidase [Bacteroidales bacterium]